MAYNSAKGLVDYYQGCSDLKAGIIRCVGNADERFREDALRIIRAMRFASVLGFVIEKDTALSMRRNKELLSRVSRERINVELCKLLRGKGIKHILREYKDILAVIMPELTPMFGFQQNNPHHKYDVWEHTVIAVDSSINEIIIRLALLLHDIGKPECYTCDSNGIGHFYSHGEFGAEMAKKILKDLKFDNLTVNNVCQLVKYHDADINESNQFIKKWLNKIGDSQFDRLLQVKYADVMGQSDYQREKKLKKLENIEKIKKQVFQESQCYSLKDLAVNGRDLIEVGIQDGKKIGEILEWLLEQVIENRLENQRGDLIEAAKSI
jgi:tRNA nucleotidyltransferase (CCA-adding enzyme)